MGADDMKARTPAPEGEAVAWFRQSRASPDDWYQVKQDEVSDLRRLGNIVQPLYASPVVPAPEGEAWRTVPVEPTEAMVRAFGDARPDNAIQDDEGGWSAPSSDWFRAKYTAMLAASPVVPVGVRERVLDELDKAWLHGQRRTSWRRDESADAILAALCLTDTGRKA